VLKKNTNPTSALPKGQGDDRLATIFRQRYLFERSAEEIGNQFQLHPSRIRALLKQARLILAEDPTLRAWLDDENEAHV
jgi:DNA-directed RNA polymerase specialized sigma24 family protein